MTPVARRPPSDIGYAKLNLALHVRRRGGDGYHAIETIFAFCADGDGIALEDFDPAGEFAADANRISLAVTGPFADGLDGPDNLILRAAARFAERFGLPGGARFTLDKRLPVASGIGGGSADAAAALRLLCARAGVPPAEVADIAAGLGADVPACLSSVTQRGEGRGDALRPVASGALAGLPVLLVNPRVAVPTGPVFRGWDGIDRGGLPQDDPLVVAQGGRNDLEPPARVLQPVIAAVVDRLRARPGVLLARMSGSGATCFALFADAAARDAADAAIATAEPGWWRLATHIR